MLFGIYIVSLNEVFQEVIFIIFVIVLLQFKVADDSLVVRPAGAYRNAIIPNSITDLSSSVTLTTTHKTQSNRLQLPDNQLNATTTMLYNHVLPYYHPSNYSSLSCYPVSAVIFSLVDYYMMVDPIFSLTFFLRLIQCSGVHRGHRGSQIITTNSLQAIFLNLYTIFSTLFTPDYPFSLLHSLLNLVGNGEPQYPATFHFTEKIQPKLYLILRPLAFVAVYGSLMEIKDISTNIFIRVLISTFNVD